MLGGVLCILPESHPALSPQGLSRLWKGQVCLLTEEFLGCPGGIVKMGHSLYTADFNPPPTEQVKPEHTAYFLPPAHGCKGSVRTVPHGCVHGQEWILLSFQFLPENTLTFRTLLNPLRGSIGRLQSSPLRMPASF